MTIFQKNLKEALKGIRPLEDFCKKIGISYKGLRSMMSRGLVKPSAKSKENLAAIGKALGFKPEELWHEKTELTKDKKIASLEAEINKLGAEIVRLKEASRREWQQHSQKEADRLKQLKRVWENWCDLQKRMGQGFIYDGGKWIDPLEYKWFNEDYDLKLKDVPYEGFWSRHGFYDVWMVKQMKEAEAELKAKAELEALQQIRLAEEEKKIAEIKLSKIISVDALVDDDAVRKWLFNVIASSAHMRILEGLNPMQRGSVFMQFINESLGTVVSPDERITEYLAVDLVPMRGRIAQELSPIITELLAQTRQKGMPQVSTDSKIVDRSEVDSPDVQQFIARHVADGEMKLKKLIFNQVVSSNTMSDLMDAPKQERMDFFLAALFKTLEIPNTSNIAGRIKIGLRTDALTEFFEQETITRNRIAQELAEPIFTLLAEISSVAREQPAKEPPEKEQSTG